MVPTSNIRLGPGIGGWVTQFQDALDEMRDDDLERWQQAGEELKTAAQKSWHASRQMGGIAREGAVRRSPC